MTTHVDHIDQLDTLPVTEPAPRRLPPAAQRFRESVREIADDLADRVRKPAAVQRIAELAPGERALGHACEVTGTTIVATDAALHRLTGSGAGEHWSRWGWEQIANIRWISDTRTLALRTLAPGLPPRIELWFSDRVPLIELAQERVCSTRLLDLRVRLSGGTVHVTARRDPRTDRRCWYVYPDPGLDVQDPGTRAELDDAIARLRAATGL